MKTKIAEFNKNMVKYIKKVAKTPSPSMINVYDMIGRELLSLCDFNIMLHLAVNISDRYKAAKLNVWYSRELEMLIYDMSLKGYSMHEMAIVCHIAAYCERGEGVANQMFGCIGKVLMDQVKGSGDVIFEVTKDVFCAIPKQKSLNPKLTDKQFFNN